MNDIQPSRPKFLVLICFIFGGMLISGAFQNCASQKIVNPEEKKVVLIDKAPESVEPARINTINRAPANAINDMILSSESEIRKTRENLEDGMPHEGGAYSVTTRQVATTHEMDLMPLDNKNDSMKIKLKVKRRK